MQKNLITFLLIRCKPTFLYGRAKAVIGQRHMENIVVVFHLNLIFFFRGFTGFRIGHCMGACLRACTHLHFFLKCERILPVKQCL